MAPPVDQAAKPRFRVAPSPASDAVMASLQADARMAKADHQVNDAKDRSPMHK